jgi:hypothetical protein
MAAEQSKPQGPDLGQGVSVSDTSDGGMLAESGQLNALGGQDSSRLDAYWRAANYLSVGQIYLLDNPLLLKPLKPEHIKPRLLGHWGTTPGIQRPEWTCRSSCAARSRRSGLPRISLLENPAATW